MQDDVISSGKRNGHSEPKLFLPVWIFSACLDVSWVVPVCVFLSSFLSSLLFSSFLFLSFPVLSCPFLAFPNAFFQGFEIFLTNYRRFPPCLLACFLTCLLFGLACLLACVLACLLLHAFTTLSSLFLGLADQGLVASQGAWGNNAWGSSFCPL